MSNLRATLDSLANDFASSVLAAIRGASLQELLSEAGGAAPRGGGGRAGRRAGGRRAAAAAPGAAAPARAARGRGGRLKRRSPADIKQVLDKVHGLLRGKKDGLRSEEIQKALRLDKREMPRVLTTGVTSRRLSKRGEKRATRYYAR